jgi:diaminopimelate epimerase
MIHNNPPFIFTKMHALGNDFIVINALSAPIHLTKERIAYLSDRHTGIGFDQCLIIHPPKTNKADFYYQIFNANGNEVGQCGNGARCVFHYLKQKNISTKNSITLETNTTLMTVSRDNEYIAVKFNAPLFHPLDIPILFQHPNTTYPIPIENQDIIDVHAVNVGNPHAIIMVDDIDKAPVATLGKFLSNHPLFPDKANISFCHIINKNHANLRVYERDAGETRACGSAAIATAVILKTHYQGTSPLTINLPGGSLLIQWNDKDDHVYLLGNATMVFDGTCVL